MFKIIKNEKTYFEVWNDKEKIGYYCMLKADENFKLVWIVRKFTNKPFSAREVGKFENKESAVKFIYDLIRECHEKRRY